MGAVEVVFQRGEAGLGSQVQVEGQQWKITPLALGLARKTGKLQRKKQGILQKQRKVQEFKRGFEVVRETVIHVENFPVDY